LSEYLEKVHGSGQGLPRQYQTPTELPLDTVRDHTSDEGDEDWFVIQF
jgi:hypothetical protein